MRVLWGHSEAVAQWVGWRIPYVARRMARNGPEQPFGPAQAAGILDASGVLVAGVVYSNYDPDCPSMELSFAAATPRWLTRPIICELLRYPFETANCLRITGVTPRKATSARRFLEKFGFKREGLVRRGFGTDDAVISGLLRTEWQASKWAKPLPERLKLREEPDGQAKAAPAA